jgi:hypothetical protein
VRLSGEDLNFEDDSFDWRSRSPTRMDKNTDMSLVAVWGTCDLYNTMSAGAA